MENLAKEIWEKLSAIDCSEHVEKKGRFSYLSWAWAWHILKKEFPEAQFVKHCNENGYPYFTDPNGYAFVKVTVRIRDVEASEMLYVMDNKNQAIKNPTSGDVNASLQRCLVKAIAFLGLGLYIYSGEDLPEDAPKPEKGASTEAPKTPKSAPPKPSGSPNQTIEERINATSDFAGLKALYKEVREELEAMKQGERDSAIALFANRKKVFPETEVEKETKNEQEIRQ